MFLQELNRSRTWDAFREMQRLESQLSKLLSDTRGPVNIDFPPVNVWVSEDSAVVTAEIPGVKPEDIDLSVVNETLTIRGSHNPESDGNSERFHRRERSLGQFTRTIELPFRVNADKVNAKFKNGILSVSLPRAEEDKPKKISVQSA